jgi:hypothetical protein
MPDLRALAKGLIPTTPDMEGADRLMVAIVGITKASMTIFFQDRLYSGQRQGGR